MQIERIRTMGKMKIGLGRGTRLKPGEEPLTECFVFSAPELGEALRRRRREIGYTQETAARLCGHSIRLVGDIERGRDSVGIGAILDYAEILEVDVAIKVRER